MMGAWPTLVLDASKTEWWESRVGRPFWFADNLHALPRKCRLARVSAGAMAWTCAVCRPISRQFGQHSCPCLAGYCCQQFSGLRFPGSSLQRHFTGNLPWGRCAIFTETLADTLATAFAGTFMGTPAGTLPCVLADG